MMKVKPAQFFYVLFAFVSLVLLILFRTVPVSRLWKGYVSFYVYSSELSESDISYILEKNDVENFICQQNQLFPVVSSVSPVQPQSSDSYIYARNAFFTDKTKSARVFYVPDSESKNLQKAALEISSFQNSVCGTDGKSSFPWISPLVSLFFALVLLHFSKEKNLFAFSSVFPVILSFCRPMYTVAAASVFLLFAFFLLQKIWQRRNFKKTFLNSPYALTFAFSPFLILIFSSIQNALLYALALTASVSCVKIYHQKEIARSEKSGFEPLMIMSSRMIPIIGHTGIRLMGFMSLVLLALGIAFVFLGNVPSSSASPESPELPAPVSSKEASLPNLDDFFGWSFETLTFPYKKISSAARKPSDGEEVLIPDYALNSDGFISESDAKMYVYDEKFRENVERQAENLSYPALEKMMIRQGKNSCFGYSKGKISSSEKFGPVLLSVFVLISAGFSGIYILGRKRYGQSI